MELLLKCAAFGVVGAVSAMIIKSRVPEIGLMITLLTAFAIAFFALTVFGSIMEFLNEIANGAGISREMLTPMYKLLGVGIVSKLASDVSRDANESAIANAIELAGTAAGIYIALPLIEALIDTVKGLL